MCKWFLGAFVLLYVAALALLVIGTFGLLGSPRGPLAGVFLVPLGLPWNLLLDGFPDALRPWFAAGAPLLNALILWVACRLIGTRFARRSSRPTHT
jgi:hypothetical protein